MPVADLCDHVVEQGWSLPNIGVIKAQTVAGLLATASHGRCHACARSCCNDTLRLGPASEGRYRKAVQLVREETCWPRGTGSVGDSVGEGPARAPWQGWRVTCCDTQRRQVWVPGNLCGRRESSAGTPSPPWRGMRGMRWMRQRSSVRLCWGHRPGLVRCGGAVVGLWWGCGGAVAATCGPMCVCAGGSRRRAVCLWRRLWAAHMHMCSSAGAGVGRSAACAGRGRGAGRRRSRRSAAAVDAGGRCSERGRFGRGGFRDAPMYLAAFRRATTREVSVSACLACALLSGKTPWGRIHHPPPFTLRAIGPL